MPHRLPLLFLAIWFYQPSAAAQGDFTIKARISGLKDSAIVYLMHNDGTVLSPVAKDTVINGEFSFSVKPEDPGITAYALMGDGGDFPSTWVDIWGAPGKHIDVIGKGYLLKNWAVKSNIPEQLEAARYFAPSAADWWKWQALRVEERQLRKQTTAANSETIRASADSLNKLAQALMDKILDVELISMRKMPKTAMWKEKFKRAAINTKFSPRETYRQSVIGLYNALSAEERKSRWAMETRGYLYPPVVVKKGEPMADTTMIDLDAKTHRLADYKGSYLLLDFWSVGCGPCIAAMPELDSISTQLAAKLKVVSINIDEKRAVWKKFMAGKKPATINLNDDWGMAGLAARYGVSGIPHYVMISPEGIVLDHWVGYRRNELIKKVEGLLQ